MTSPTTDRDKLEAMLAPLGIKPLRVEYDEQDRLTLLDLQDTGLEALPEAIGQLTRLKTMRLGKSFVSWNKDRMLTLLEHLPDSVWQLSNLQELDLSFTAINRLPPEIGQLTALQTLDLWHTAINQLPLEIGQLSSLQMLDLRDTPITHLPPEIGQLIHLQELYLSGTNTSQLPAEIGQLANLRELDLDSTQISQLPPELGQLSNLEELRLSNTSISQLPPEFGQLIGLQELELGNLSLNAVPHKLRDRCYWHGTHLPADFFPISAWTAQRILNEPNTEIRRLMLERYGEAHFIEELGAQPHHQDDYGILYRVEIANDEPLVMVKVKDAGTDREYFLRVPPGIETAHEAVAWTFGMAVDEYRPDRET